MEKIRNKFYESCDENTQKEYEKLFIQRQDNPSKINEFDKLLEFIELQKDKDEIDLSYVCFHESYNFIYLNEILKKVGFINYSKKNEKIYCRINKRINFGNANFYKEMEFIRVTFEKRVNFEGANFYDNVNFHQAVFQEDKEGLPVEQYGTIFEGVKFHGEAIFEDTSFEDDAKFFRVTFNKYTSFERTIFKKAFNLENSISKDLFYFFDVKIGNINLIGSDMQRMNFLNLKNIDSRKPELTKRNFKNKDSARFLKYHFELQNNITEANKYFTIEQEFFLDSLNDKSSPEPRKDINKVTVYFNKYISYFGTDWVRPLFVLFGLGYFFILLYSLFNLDSINEHRYIIIKSEDYKWMICGLFTSILSYLLYIWNHKFSNLLLLIVLLYFIQALLTYANLRELSNSIVTLLNPLNIFNQDLYYEYNVNSKYKEYLININYFEKIALYGVIVKFITVSIVYQFIMALRNSTRRK